MKDKNKKIYSESEKSYITNNDWDIIKELVRGFVPTHYLEVVKSGKPHIYFEVTNSRVRWDFMDDTDIIEYFSEDRFSNEDFELYTTSLLNRTGSYSVQIGNTDVIILNTDTLLTLYHKTVNGLN